MPMMRFVVERSTFSLKILGGVVDDDNTTLCSDKDIVPSTQTFVGHKTLLFVCLNFYGYLILTKIHTIAGCNSNSLLIY